MAQWKRAGPITQRSVDRNYALLVDFFNFVHSDWICQSGALRCCLLAALVPLAQRIARWTSNPKVLGSIPRWDDFFFFSSFISSLLLRASLGKKEQKKNTFSNPNRLHEGDIAQW